MTYASAARKPNSAAIAGALGIPGAFGALLVVGLAVTVVSRPDAPRLKGETITETPLTPPPPADDTKQPPTTTTTRSASVTDLPPRADMLPVDLGLGDPLAALPGTGELIGTDDIIDEIAIPRPTPSIPAFTPVGAAARNNPARWVTDADYRPRWIREGLAGRASFRLAIDASGKVTGCTVTRSTGHPALDMATCELVTKRALFEAARDSTGRPVAGGYSGAITWQIP